MIVDGIMTQLSLVLLAFGAVLASRLRLHVPTQSIPSRQQIYHILKHSSPADKKCFGSSETNAESPTPPSGAVHEEIAWMIEKVWTLVIKDDDQPDLISTYQWDSEGLFNENTLHLRSRINLGPSRISNDQLLRALCTWVSRYKARQLSSTYADLWSQTTNNNSQREQPVVTRPHILHPEQLVWIVGTMGQIKGRVKEQTFRSFLLTILCSHLRIVLEELVRSARDDRVYEWYRVIGRAILYNAIGWYDKNYLRSIPPELEMAIHSL